MHGIGPGTGWATHRVVDADEAAILEPSAPQRGALILDHTPMLTVVAGPGQHRSPVIKSGPYRARQPDQAVARRPSAGEQIGSTNGAAPQPDESCRGRLAWVGSDRRVDGERRAGHR